MTTSPPGAPNLDAPPPSRSPWQRFYGSVHRWRRNYWRRHQRRLPRPVISIGNLHWGGSGKTPLTAAVAARLRDNGLRVTILSRGYGSRGRGTRLVSRGQGPLLNTTQGGDEPVLLAEMLPGVCVVVDPDRYAAGRHALQALDAPPDVFLLDDGFSHLRLARDIDLLVFPASDPFAGGRLPPGGRLREPLASAQRADAVLLTGGDDAAQGRRLAKALEPYGFGGPGFICRSRLRPPQTTLQGRPIADGARVLALSAIARPEVFVASLERRGFKVVERLDFPDHHTYGASSWRKIRQRFAASRADVVITTDKDRVKLQSGAISSQGPEDPAGAAARDIPLAVLALSTEPEPDFFPWLETRLAAARGLEASENP